MQIITIGIDLARDCISDSRCRCGWHSDYLQASQTGGGALVRVGSQPCLIGMEACATSHHWAREMAKFGHTMKLMPPPSNDRTSAMHQQPPDIVVSSLSCRTNISLPWFS